MKKFISILDKKYFVFVLLAALVIADRIILLCGFNFHYTGNDDIIYWLSTRDYMNGVFHEPYFYGQNYNFMLESLPAVLLVKLGVFYQYALPISTSLLALFPYIFFSVILFRAGKIIEAIIILFIILALPVEFGMLTSITRGFVTGMFFSGFLIFPALYPTKKSSIFIFGLCLSIGYIFNPNSLIVSFPVGVYLLFKNYRQIYFYLIVLFISLPVLLIEYYAKQFYKINVDYNVAGMWDLNYKFMTFLKGFGNLDRFFNYLTPVVWPVGWLSIPVLFFLGYKLLKVDRAKGIGILSGVIFILVLMGVNKINDDIGTVFLCSSRMFLGIPLLTGLAFSWSKIFIPVSDKQWKYLLFTASILFFVIKISIYKPVIKYNIIKENWGAVAVKNIDELKNECGEISRIANMNRADLIICVPYSDKNIAEMEFYDFGCSFLIEDFPSSLITIYERRTWVYLEEKKAIRKTVLIFGSDLTANDFSQVPDCKLISENPKLILINNNTLSTEELLKRFNIRLRRHLYD